MGAAPRPPLVPAGAPWPWEGSVRGGGGSSRTEPSVFLSCVGGLDLMCAPGSPNTPVPVPAPGSEPRQCHGHGAVLDSPCQSSTGHGVCVGVTQRLWGAHGCCGAHGAMGTAPTPRFLAHSPAGCQLCRDFASSPTPGVFQCLFSYGAAPVLPPEALPEVPPARRVLRLCQTCHRLGHGTVLVPPDQLAQRRAELESLGPSLPG